MLRKFFRRLRKAKRRRKKDRAVPIERLTSSSVSPAAVAVDAHAMAGDAIRHAEEALNARERDKGGSAMQTDLPLPPQNLRFGSGARRSDAEYIESAMSPARTLERLCGLNQNSRLLDIGCGQGRLLIGIIKRLGRVRRYVGIDVHEPSLRWLRENLSPLANWAEFFQIDYLNERYNPKGKREINFSCDERFDCISLLSVFSHMWLNDISVYLHFIRSVLEDGGKVYLTCFVENDVPPETENPPGYLADWSGRLHCIRLNKQEFERRIADAGLSIEYFGYREAGRIQSVYVLQLAS